MKKLMLVLGSLVLLCIVSAPSFAGGGKGKHHFKPKKKCFCGICWQPKHRPKHHRPKHSVPEIDAAGAAIALAFAAGVISIGRERRKKS